MEPATLAIGAFALWLLRGRTGELEPLSDADAAAMGRAVCDALGDESDVWASPEGIARAVGRQAYGDLSWPPRPLATASHKAAWAQLIAWGTDVRSRADALGVSVCSLLAGGALIPVPLPAIPVPPPSPSPGFSLGGLPEPGPSPLPTIPTVPMVVTDDPTPGAWYRIAYGDTLLGVAGRAYGLPPGTMRLNRAKLINGAQANAGLRFSEPDSTFEQTHFPAGALSFLPPYQTIYIPAV